MSFNPQILYEDDFLLAIDKPAGIVVNEAVSVGNAETVQDWAAEYIFRKNKIKDNSLFFQRKGIIHRLDKDTSGILLVAKNEAVMLEMQSLFKERKIKKKYLALVHGTVEKEGTMNFNVMRFPGKGKMIVDEKGKTSLTEYKRINKFVFNEEALGSFEKLNYQRLTKKYNISDYSFVEARIFTGRTHQIRVHFSFIHHPVVGDALYGFRKLINFEKLWCPRQFLHAAELTFNHPITNKKIDLKSALPADLKEILEKYMYAS